MWKLLTQHSDFCLASRGFRHIWPKWNLFLSLSPVVSRPVLWVRCREQVLQNRDRLSTIMGGGGVAFLSFFYKYPAHFLSVALIKPVENLWGSEGPFSPPVASETGDKLGGRAGGAGSHVGKRGGGSVLRVVEFKTSETISCCSQMSFFLLVSVPPCSLSNMSAVGTSSPPLLRVGDQTSWDDSAVSLVLWKNQHPTSNSVRMKIIFHNKTSSSVWDKERLCVCGERLKVK